NAPKAWQAPWSAGFVPLESKRTTASSTEQKLRCPVEPTVTGSAVAEYSVLLVPEAADAKLKPPLPLPLPLVASTSSMRQALVLSGVVQAVALPPRALKAAYPVVG